MYGDKPQVELPKRYLAVFILGKMFGRIWGWKLKRQLKKEVKKLGRISEKLED